MDNHLDDHPNYYPIALPMVGRITDIICKDKVGNPSEESTYYQVKVFPQKPPACPFTYPFVPALGQLGGGGNDTEDPYLKGDTVIVAFLEGDPNRPYISGLYTDLGEDIPDVAQTTAQHPQVKRTRNGTTETIDKDGNRTFALAENQKMTFTDSAGNVLLQLVKTGGAYEVQLGGDVGLSPLVLEGVKDLILGHTHPVVGAVATALTASTVPTAAGLLLWLSSYVTSVAKGK